MDKNNKQWTKVSPLPQKCIFFSAAVCGDTLYLAAGSTGGLLGPLKSVFSCSLSHLLPPTTLTSKAPQASPTSHNVWRQINSLPVTQSTLVSFGGDLLGGTEYFNTSTCKVPQ